MKRKSQHYIVFGVGNKADKAIIVGPSKRLPGYECNIVSLNDRKEYKIGEEVEASDIEGIYTTLYFTRLSSLWTFANTLHAAAIRWEKEIESEYE